MLDGSCLHFDLVTTKMPFSWFYTVFTLDYKIQFYGVLLYTNLNQLEFNWNLLKKYTIELCFGNLVNNVFRSKCDMKFIQYINIQRTYYMSHTTFMFITSQVTPVIMRVDRLSMFIVSCFNVSCWDVSVLDSTSSQ